MHTPCSLVRLALLAVLPVAVCAIATPAASAAGSVSGTVALHAAAQTDGPGATDASWALAGGLQPARAAAAQLGTAVQAGPDQDTDSRYALATLSASQASWSTSCGDLRPGGVVTQSMPGIVDARSAIEVEVVFDQLRGRGTVHVAPADSVSPSAPGYAFAPGLVTRQVDNGCADPVDTASGPMPVLSHAGESLLPGDMLDWTNGIAWPLRRHGAHGAWTGGGTATRDVDGLPESVSTSITVSGSGVALHARCTLPTARNLRAAKTFRAARAVVVRAGFAAPRLGKYRKTRAAKAGHWYLREGVGNRQPRACGSGRLHLDRSLGARRR